jgi:hypothetical protein
MARPFAAVLKMRGRRALLEMNRNGIYLSFIKIAPPRAGGDGRVAPPAAVLSSAKSLADQSGRLKTEVDKFLATVRAA